MDAIPGREATPISEAPKLGGPKKLKRRKKPVSQAQRSRVASANAKKATRDEQGRFARKGIFTHIFDGIETVVGGVKKAHKKVKRVHRAIRKAARQQPQMREVRSPQRRRRQRRGTRKTASQAARQPRQQEKQGGLWKAVSYMFGW